MSGSNRGFLRRIESVTFQQDIASHIVIYGWDTFAREESRGAYIVPASIHNQLLQLSATGAKNIVYH